MKTLFKFCLVLSFCFAALCARNLGFQVDSIAVATQNNFGAPYLYLSIGGSLYLVNLQSIYEIYVDPNTNQWMKDFSTETTFDKLSWKINSNLAQGNVALLGTPCPCQNANQSQNLEPFQTRRVGRQVRDDPFEEVTCTPANFDYLRFVFQYVPGMNNTACTPIDLGMCTTECTQACSNVTNATSCNAGCSAITSASIADTNLCYTACNNSGTLDNDCVNGCLNMIGCISEYSCRLDFGYHLHKYMWSNVTGGNSNASRKLAFAFEIVPQANVENVTCGAEVAHWINGPFVLWINTTCLAGIHQDGCVECLPDLTNATEVPAVANFGPGPNSVVGRFYVDPFTGGYSIFNQPVEIINPISTTSR